jgi:hypothetical protein
VNRLPVLREQALLLFVLLSLSLPCACREERAIPTARPLPTPDNRAIYDMMTANYTSEDIILSIYDMSAAESARILSALEAIQPPADLEVVHAQAVRAYQHIVKGKLLLPGADSLLRAEAKFMIDWGISLLRGYREQLEAIPR